MVKGKKRKKEKKEVCEIVEIEKEGKKEIKKICGTEEEKSASKEQIKKQDKQLKIVLGVLGIIVLAFLLFLLINYKLTHFTYEGVKFKVVREGNLIFYNTYFELHSEEGGHIANYNFYIRNDPRKLEKIPFEGEFVITENMVINMTEDFHCEGDGVIAIANFVKLHEFLGIKVIQDPEAGCELTGKYTFVRILSGNETKIEQYGPSCYRIYINDCEILKGTERFMVETFVEANEFLKK